MRTVKTEKRQNPQRFRPTVGGIYENVAGGRYLCTDVYPGEREAARMKNVETGWTLRAVGLVRYEDGTIEWDYSTEGRFADRPELSDWETRHRQHSLLNALLCMGI